MNQEAGSGTADAAAIEAKSKGWSEADIRWLEAVAVPFRPIAVRHGRMLFSLVMQAGLAGVANGVLHQCIGFLQSRHMKQKGMEALQRSILVSNDLLSRVMSAEKITREAFLECQKDIEQMGSLANETPNAGAGRIILPN